MAKENKTIHEKLSVIQSTLKAPKDLRNSFGNYNYRSAESILEAVKPILTANECYINVSDELLFFGDRFYVKATASILDFNGNVVSSTALAREEEVKKGMDSSQITGAASSYARKYALNGLLAIDDTKDADATNTHDKEPTATPKPVEKVTPKTVSTSTSSAMQPSTAFEIDTPEVAERRKKATELYGKLKTTKPDVVKAIIKSGHKPDIKMMGNPEVTINEFLSKGDIDKVLAVYTELTK
jgi:hypothetical protein